MFNSTTDRDALIMEWNEAKSALDAAKEKESELRKRMVDECFPHNPDSEGTENLELGEGWKLKTVFKQNRRLGNKNGETDKALTKIEKMGAEGEIIADRLVKWEPKLSLSEYKKLPAKMKKIIDDVITTAPGTPTVSLVPPKGK